MALGQDHSRHAAARRRRARVGLVGVGTVGSAVARMLADHGERPLRLVRVCARSADRPRPAWLPPAVGWTSRFDDLLADDVDILVELVGGLSPAADWVRRALEAGKSVVTANKQLVAEQGAQLAVLAARHRVALQYGASVAGGVPVIDAIRHGLAGDRLTRVAGILNGTCNYILSRMEAGDVSFEAALCEAQARGYAEADPRADIDGLDARAKLAILCAVAFRRPLRTPAIPVSSIAGLTPGDFADARSRGATIRQVSRAECPVQGGPVRASVGPELVARDSILGRVQGCDNALVVTGEHGGDTIYAGRGAGGEATAVAVISDLLAITRTRYPAGLEPRPSGGLR